MEVESTVYIYVGNRINLRLYLQVVKPITIVSRTYFVSFTDSETGITCNDSVIVVEDNITQITS